jgi:hypothetical protein
VAAALLAGCGDDGGPAEPQAAAKRPGAVTLLAVGDVGRCDGDRDEAVADLVAAEPGAQLAVLGDLAYEDGLKEQFEGCYDPSWGRFKDRTHPVPGNHEYQYFAKDAAAYFDYFGAAAGPYGTGYYSYSLGSWKVIALNSNCDAAALGGCGPDSPQGRWLAGELEADRGLCTLAYWHHPRFSSGGMHGSDPQVAPLWDALYERGADVVLGAHEHNYQRFAPQDPSGNADSDRGVRQFVVGTGGAPLYRFPTDPLPTAEVQRDDTYGILVLELYPSGYDWRFEPVAGQTFKDSGSGRCH